MLTANQEDAPGACSFTCDESRFPLVILGFRGTPSDAELSAFLTGLERLWRRRERYVSIFDATYAAPLTATQRRIMADWGRRNAGSIKQYDVGLAVVVPSVLLRGIVTAVHWIHPHPTPCELTATFEEAERWALSRASAAGLRVPPARPR